MSKRKQIKTHSSISVITPFESTDEARAFAWSALVSGHLVLKVWLADTGRWQVCVNEVAQ